MGDELIVAEQRMIATTKMGRDMAMMGNTRSAMMIAGALAIWAALTTPAQAGTPYEKQMTCPVGGKTFTYTATGSFSTFGSRPDGKPYGSWVFPMPLPECPTNRLVVYRDFLPEEIAPLTQLVQSPEYAALHGETPYYRAQWLSTRMDAGKVDYPLWLLLLLQASWEVDDDLPRKARYQAEFVERAAAFPIDPPKVETLILRFRVANALRELGRFDEALIALDTIPLDVPTPLVGDPTIDNEEDREAREYLAEQGALLREYIARRDTSSEPVRMVPESTAAFICALATETAATDIDPFCSSPAMIGPVEEARQHLREVNDMVEDSRLSTPGSN